MRTLLRAASTFSCHDSSSKPLTRKILDRPRLIARIRRAIADKETMVLVASIDGVLEGFAVMKFRDEDAHLLLLALASGGFHANTVLAVSAVLVAIVWALVDKRPSTPGPAPAAEVPLATVELLGVPDDGEVLLDGQRIDNTRFGVTPGTRHLLEVTDDEGRSWRQVFLANGSLSLVVELRTHFVEVEVDRELTED